jgi:hypothetical protein
MLYTHMYVARGPPTVSDKGLVESSGLPLQGLHVLALGSVELIISMRFPFGASALTVIVQESHASICCAGCLHMCAVFVFGGFCHLGFASCDAVLQFFANGLVTVCSGLRRIGLHGCCTGWSSQQLLYRMVARVLYKRCSYFVFADSG